MLGIAIISYNRQHLVQRCVESIRQYTIDPYRLVVADDDSTDGTLDYCREAKVPFVTGENRGCAWNKNRGLLWLMRRTDCRELLLIEDDTHPDRYGWDRNWREAIERWGHVNVTTDPNQGEDRIGGGKPNDPYWCKGFWGNCSGFTRAAIDCAGYLDSRFTGYGWEHVEHTWRVSNALADRVPGWRKGHTACLSATTGVKPTWDAPSHHPGDAKVGENYKVYQQVADDPIPRPVAHTREMSRLIHAEIMGWPTGATVAARGDCQHLGPRTEFREGCGGRMCHHTCLAGEPVAVPGGICQSCAKWEADQ